jgi:hypothetical protein
MPCRAGRRIVRCDDEGNVRQRLTQPRHDPHFPARMEMGFHFVDQYDSRARANDGLCEPCRSSRLRMMSQAMANTARKPEETAISRSGCWRCCRPAIRSR